MVKYCTMAMVAALIGFALWFNSWTGPQQLNFADSAWFWVRQPAAESTIAVAYGRGERQKLDIYVPSRAKNAVRAGKTAPQKVLIFFHGGSWRDGDRASYAFFGRAFAARGFVTVIADYRKIPRARFPAFIDDAAGVVGWVHKNIARYSGDSDAIFLVGHSAGAHIAMMAALDPQYLAKQGLNTAQIKGVIGLAGPYDFLPFTGDDAKIALGAWPRPEETQPVHYARADAPPLLLLTGDKDETVQPRNSRALAAAITATGGHAETKAYRGVDHSGIIMATARPFRDRAPVIEDIAAFVGEH